MDGLKEEVLRGVSQGLKPRIWADLNVRAEARTYLRSNSKGKE
jgi:hypothetical protein